MSVFIKRPERPQIVEATQVAHGVQVHLSNTPAPKPGDWIVTDHSTGKTWTMPNDLFESMYEPIPIPEAPVPAQPTVTVINTYDQATFA